jgi:hypothetical protein
MRTLFLIFALFMAVNALSSQTTTAARPYCQATTQAGNPCKNKASAGATLCGTHQKVKAKKTSQPATVKTPCQATTKAGHGCKRHAMTGGTYCFQHEPGKKASTSPNSGPTLESLTAGCQRGPVKFRTDDDQLHTVYVLPSTNAAFIVLRNHATGELYRHETEPDADNAARKAGLQPPGDQTTASNN